MGYPIKTSNDQWLAKTRELYYQRVSMDIEDDGNYFIEENSYLFKEFSKITLPNKTMYILIVFYALALISIILGYLSVTLTNNYMSGLLLSFLGAIVCIFIPTKIILKNKAPNISATESGYKITFNRKAI